MVLILGRHSPVRQKIREKSPILFIFWCYGGRPGAGRFGVGGHRAGFERSENPARRDFSEHSEEKSRRPETKVQGTVIRILFLFFASLTFVTIKTSTQNKMSDVLPSQETMGLTKTIMTYSQGDLVLYGGIPYLVENYDANTMRLVMKKIEGGTKRVRPSLVQPVEPVRGTKFQNVTDIPLGVLRSFLPSLITLVGAGWNTKLIIPNQTELSGKEINFKPIGKSALNLFNDLQNEYEDLGFSKSKLKSRVLLLVVYDKPKLSQDHIKSHLKEFMTTPSVIVCVKGQDPPEGFSAHIDIGEFLTGFRKSWIIQTNKSLSDLTRDQKSLIVGLGLARGRVGKKLDVPR